MKAKRDADDWWDTLHEMFAALADEEKRHRTAMSSHRLALGNLIRRRRETMDISLRCVAEEVAISAAFLSDIELGRRSPSLTTFNLLLDALS